MVPPKNKMQKSKSQKREQNAKPQCFIFEDKTQRLDVFLSFCAEGYSRGIIQKIIKEGRVLVNGKKQVKPSFELEDGDAAEVFWPSAEQNKIILKDLIVFENKDFFVIDKPAGLLVHPQSSVWENNPQAVYCGGDTLVSAVLSAPPKGFDVSLPRLGLVHRLDRETSGIMLIAKNKEFQEAAAQMFADRQMHKTYLAICCGAVPSKEGTIDVPIGRLAGGKIKAGELGRNALTAYKRLKTNGKFSLMELYPKTGRTNQLRVHMAWLGYPVLGDWLYKGASAPRLMLHALRLEFKHPFTNKDFCFEVKPPKDFKQSLKLCFGK